MRKVALIILAATVLASCTSPNFSVSGASGSAQGEFWLAFLQEPTNKPKEVIAARYNNSNQLIGTAFLPFGTAAPDSLTRPALAYSSKSNNYLVAVAQPASSATGTYHRVAARFFNATGALQGTTIYLFDDQSSTIQIVTPSIDVGQIRVTYNELQNEFLITAQRVVDGKNGLWTQRLSQSKGILSPPHKLFDTGKNGFTSHSVAYAPVTGSSPAGGRYLVAYGAVSALMLKSDGKLATVVPLDLGTPSGGTGHPDVAYGTVEGKARFLVVYSDQNNCQPGVNPCKSWTGVWGTYVDPANLKPTKSNTPFPVSKIDQHTGTKWNQAQVAYLPAAKAFVVAWREIPSLHPNNDESRSHIRAAKVDYFVADGLANTSQVTLPNANLVVSSVTGTGCVPKTPCLSKENPQFPSVTPVGTAAAIHWEQKVSGAATLQVRGGVYKFP